MSELKKPAGTPDRQVQAATRPRMVRLDELVLVARVFCHRDEEELNDPARLRSLADAIFATGLQVPIEFFVDEQGRLVVTSGHRRTSAVRLNVKEKRPGFTPDMEIPAIEITGASRQQLLLRSVSDNCNRLTLTQTDRIRAAKTLAENGVREEDAARAFAVSVKTYKRDLLISTHDWMFQMVNTNDIAASNASRLLEVATTEKRVAELQEDLTTWVAEIKRKISEDKKKKKDLTAAQQLVKTYMTTPLFNHWLAQLKKKERFTPVPAANVDVEVGIDAAKNKVSIGGTEIDLMTVPLSQLAELVSNVESAKRVMLSYLKTRKAVEARGPQDVAREESESPSGLDVLREAGLADLADEIELKRMEDAEAASQSGEDSANAKQNE